jgi:hypothetical protein
MKNLKFIVTIVISAFIIQSCSDKKEQVVLDFLNKSELEFDKTKYELVELKLVDTIFETDIPDYNNFSEYPKLNPEDYELDSIMVDDNYIQTQVYWGSSTYSKQFYDFLRYDGNYSNYTIEYELPNKFLNNLVKTDYYSFSNKFLSDISFQKQLKEEISNYDYFKGVFSSDSLIKFIELENIKRKTIYGFLYNLSFRTNSVLQRRQLIFDSKNQKIISYKNQKSN